jgi:hypothetical protein
MSTLAIVLIAIGVVVLILLVLGLLGARARDRHRAPDWTRNVGEADAALEQARASDRGWDRDAMSTAARAALADSRPGSTFDELLLVLVDDRPGVEEDRAHFVALRGSDEAARVVIARRGESWVAESVD